jgi:hypothetical protein
MRAGIITGKAWLQGAPMKKYISILLIALAATASAQTFRTPATKKNIKRAPTPPPIYKENVQGVIPRAVRGGNPLQMLNPKAPAKYGTAAQSVILDPDTGKWRGIKLFEIFF